MLEEIQEWVGDKSILVVGNGPKVNESEGEVVVRMNLGIEKPCDIWVDHDKGKLEWLDESDYH